MNRYFVLKPVVFCMIGESPESARHEILKRGSEILRELGKCETSDELQNDALQAAGEKIVEDVVAFLSEDKAERADALAMALKDAADSEKERASAFKFIAKLVVERRKLPHCSCRTCKVVDTIHGPV